jgi:hypothetical protein
MGHFPVRYVTKYQRVPTIGFNGIQRQDGTQNMKAKNVTGDGTKAVRLGTGKENNGPKKKGQR